MKFKIFSKMQHKMLAILLLVMSIPLVITSFHSIRISSKALKSQATEDFLLSSRHSAKGIKDFLKDVKRDLILLKNDPHLNKLIEQDRQAEADDIYKKVLEKFFFLSQIRKIYYQVRYIDESGQEIVRVNHDGITHEIVPSVELQNKKHRYYFQETMALSPGQIYISPLDLNREQGKVELPFNPTIRYATPLYNKKGEKRGIIILNVLADHFLKSVKERHVLKKEKTFLINEDGFYLKHPDPSKEWGMPRDLDTGENIFKDYPEEVTSKIVSGGSDTIDYQDELISYDTIFFTQDKNRYWIFIHTHPQKELFEPVAAFKKLFVIIIVISSLIAVFIGVLISSHVTKPLKDLSYWAKKVAAGDFLYRVKVSTGDEIEQLGNFLNETAFTLCERENELKTINERLKTSEEGVRKKNEELQKAFDDLKQAQSQLLQSEKMASIGQLAAGVAHEINNPVGYVISNLSVLGGYVQDIKKLLQKYEEMKPLRHELSSALQSQDKPLRQALLYTGTGEAQDGSKSAQVDGNAAQEVNNIEKTWGELDELIEKIDLKFIMDDFEKVISESQEGTERVKRIVGDLRDFSHVDEAELQYSDINKGLQSTLNIIWNELKYKAEVIKEYGEVPEISCYPMQLSQVFMNILVNASHAIEKNGEIKVMTRDLNNGEIEVRISDTGKGISEADQKKIFDPFFTTKEVGKGTGLGLSLAYRIVKKHRGRIEVQSEIGKGSTFIITLPVNGK